MKKKYNTIKNTAIYEMIEKKSKFIGHIIPVQSEKMAINEINLIRKKYRDARHNCFAYIINDIKSQNNIIKFSDDKEPSNTAGKPILDILMGELLENVLIVVTRYFGGTLLGTGGLIRAYSECTKGVLSNATKIEIKAYKIMYIKCEYNLVSKIQYEVENYIKDAKIIDIKYLDLVKFKVYVEIDHTQEFINHIINITNNLAKIEQGSNILY